MQSSPSDISISLHVLNLCSIVISYIGYNKTKFAQKSKKPLTDKSMEPQLFNTAEIFLLVLYEL